MRNLIASLFLLAAPVLAAPASPDLKPAAGADKKITEEVRKAECQNSGGYWGPPKMSKDSPPFCQCADDSYQQENSCLKAGGPIRVPADFERITFRIIKNSIIGARAGGSYSILERRDGAYALQHTQYPKTELSKQVKERQVRRFIERLQTYSDQGPGATCCDHDWTEIEIFGPKGIISKATLGMTPITISDFFPDVSK